LSVAIFAVFLVAAGQRRSLLLVVLFFALSSFAARAGLPGLSRRPLPAPSPLARQAQFCQ
jgi:hypothetical protein